jgi:hypothetical protein
VASGWLGCLECGKLGEQTIEAGKIAIGHVGIVMPSMHVDDDGQVTPGIVERL